MKANTPGGNNISVANEGQLFKKILARLMPFLFFCYLANFLDRVNVGVASLTMNKELGLTPTMFGWAAGLFFVGYCLFEIPSNLVLKRVGARIWIARIMITWGLVSAATCLVVDAKEFAIARFFLGVAEAGFAPGIVYFISRWFPAEWRGRAMSWFFVGIPLSSVIGSPISGAILQMDGMLGWSGWRWLFLLEGLPAIALGIACLFVLIEKPEDAVWLTPDERAWLQQRLKFAKDGAAVAVQRSDRSFTGAFTDPRVLLLALINFCFIFGLYGVGIWLPQIVKAFGSLGNMEVAVINAIPYVFASVGMILWARSADRTGERVWHLATAAIVGGAGLATSAVFMAAPIVAMAAITVATVGILAYLPMIFSGPGTSFLSRRDSAVGIAIITTVGNLGGFLGPYAVGWLRESTQSFTAALLGLAAVLVLAAILVFVVDAVERRTPTPLVKVSGSPVGS
jgi:MFS transporter, ACS family, tartrate transporter